MIILVGLFFSPFLLLVLHSAYRMVFDRAQWDEDVRIAQHAFEVCGGDSEWSRILAKGY
jgi:hypothetical protein